MRYAINLRGEEITARNAGPYRTGLTCPVCKTPVFLRAGGRREAHFAHYGYTAKPECILYYSGSGVARTLPPGNRSVEPRKVQDWAFSRIAYFLGSSGHETYYLTLRLPPISNAVGSLDGEIHIHAGVGLRSIPAHRLDRVNLIRVLPKNPGVPIEGTEALREFGQALAQQASLLCNGFNFFHWSIPAGRLLDTNEPLEWGRSYRILTQEVLTPPPVNGLECKRHAWRDGWDVYEVVLPPGGEVAEYEVRATLERLFAREIRAPRARAYVIDPQPHHIEIDGTLVFPESTDSLLWRITGSDECVLRFFDGRALPAREISEGWVQLSDLEAGDFVVELGGQTELLGRIEACPFFQPAGILAEKGPASVELFDTRLAELVAELGPDNWSIHCPSTAVADLVTCGADSWSRSGAEFHGNFSNLTRLDGGAFGRFEGCDVQGMHAKAKESTSPIDSLAPFRKTWLQGVVAVRHGPKVARALGAGLDAGLVPPNLAELRYLLPHILSTSRIG